MQWLHVASRARPVLLPVHHPWLARALRSSAPRRADVVVRRREMIDRQMQMRKQSLTRPTRANAERRRARPPLMRAARMERARASTRMKKPETLLRKPAPEAAAFRDRRRGLSGSALMLRFSNEGSYLNWARNGVLASGVGVAMYAQEHHRGAQLSGAGLLLLGFGFLGVGTAKFIYYIVRFRRIMELSWWSVVGTSSQASIALLIWLTGTASFLESVPLELDAMLLTEPIIDYLPYRIRQGLIETYSLYLDDLELQKGEEERVLRAIRGEREGDAEKASPPK